MEAEVDLREPTQVRLHSVEVRHANIFVEASPFSGGRFHTPLRFIVRGERTEEGQRDLVEVLQTIARGRNPYLWVREVLQVGGIPVCLVSDHNVWEVIERVERSQRRKQVLASGSLFLLTGFFLGVVGMYFLGRGRLR